MKEGHVTKIHDITLGVPISAFRVIDGEMFEQQTSFLKNNAGEEVAKLQIQAPINLLETIVALDK